MTKLVVAYAALMLLVTVSYLLPAAAFPIATLKAVIVAAVFMELARGRTTSRLALGLMVVFVALLVVGVLGDVATRYAASAYVH